MRTAKASARRSPRPTAWLKAVGRTVRAIPRGRTASYALVALMSGRPGAARAVARALHALDGAPWWRVIRSDGTLAAEVRAQQERHLRSEGVKVEDARVAREARLSCTDGFQRGPGRASATVRLPGP